MAIPLEPIAALLKEVIGLVRDFRDPAKRQANYRLHLEKQAAKKIEVADELIHTSRQYREKVSVILAIFDDKISKEDKKSLKRILKYIHKYENQYRRL